MTLERQSGVDLVDLQSELVFDVLHRQVLSDRHQLFTRVRSILLLLPLLLQHFQRLLKNGLWSDSLRRRRAGESQVLFLQVLTSAHHVEAI